MKAIITIKHGSLPARLLLIICMLFPFALSAQYQSGSGIALAVYAHIVQEKQGMEVVDLISGQLSESGQSGRLLQIGQFSPAILLLHRNDHFSEVELAYFSFRHKDEVRIATISGPFPGRTGQFSAGFRYAYNFNLLSGNTAVVAPHLGLGILPFFQSEVSKPAIRSLYTTVQQQWRISAQVIPRLMVQLTDYLLLDLNVPITFYEGRHQQLKLQNGGNLPNLRNSQLTGRWLPERIHLRLGLAVEF